MRSPGSSETSSSCSALIQFKLDSQVLIRLREKKLLVGSEDYGRDLTGVQNLRKKHKRLEAELGAHEPAIQVGSPAQWAGFGLS